MADSAALRVLAAAGTKQIDDARERLRVESGIRRRTFTLQVGVLVLWGLGSVALGLLLSDATMRHRFSGFLFSVLMYTAFSVTALAPIGVWAGRAIKRRDSAARMALVASDDPALDNLGPALQALIADARLTRSAIEGREFDDEVALRAVWEWLQRLSAVPEAERRQLADLGLGELGASGVAETLRWTIAEPEHNERGLALIAEQLRSFEHELLTAVRGPYR